MYTSASRASPFAQRADSVERALLLLATLAGAASFWLAPRLPMVDLPQHVGQVALWRDLILGVSPFSSEVWVNLFTPYLVGYGLALPLTFVIEPVEAIRLVLAVAFVAFVAAARGLRRELNGDPRVDWLFLCGFFGVSWNWGFYTFLVAAPVTLATIRLAVRFDAAPTLRRGAAVLACGLVLLFCHGLQFVFAVMVGAAIVLERALREAGANGLRAGLATALRRSGPSLALTLAFVLFMALRTALVGPEESGPVVYGAPIWTRPIITLAHIWSVGGPAALIIAGFAALIAPLFMNLAPARGPGLAMFLTVVAVQLFGVSFALNTGFLYERFALYVAPFWALCLKPTQTTRPGRQAHGTLIICVCAALAMHAWRVAAFARADRDFNAVLSAVEPGQRALGLVYDTSDPAIENPYVYLHWPLWAQSARGAFVDFNFAYFPPQVVRFKPGRTPPVLVSENWSPETLDWNAWRAGSYDVFITRGSEQQKADFLLARSPCGLDATATAGAWTLYRKTACKN